MYAGFAQMTAALALEDDPAASFLAFANEVLGFGETFVDPRTGRRGIYEWQEDAVTPFDDASERLVQVSLCTPNGSGKSAVVIPTLVLGWLAFYPRGRVVVTTADGKQLDGQVMPAIEAHRSKFPTWKFIEREILTPGPDGKFGDGGRFYAFTTDQSGRAEGWHKLDDTVGPLLIIADEAKTIPDDIFSAIDRCTYNAILLTSSPGYMHGRFWESQTKPELGFVRLKAGLADCPHIPPNKIARIIAQHGPRSPFTLSTLHGEFMLDGAESRFDFDGLERLQLIAENTHGKASRGVISEHGGTFTFTPTEHGWAWVSEHPREGLAYLAFADPMSGADTGGKKDTHACGILRRDYLDEGRIPHDEELAAAIYVEDKDAFSGAACRWELSILAHRLWLLAGYYGGCTIVPEENNYGGVLIKELLDLKADVWKGPPEETNAASGRTAAVRYGYQTNKKSKRYWVEKLAEAIFERTFICRFKPAVAQFAAFIQNEDGTCEARPGAFDDFVAGIAIGLTVGCYKTFNPRGNQGGRYWPPPGGGMSTINKACS